jgi:hypothetical protein
LNIRIREGATPQERLGALAKEVLTRHVGAFWNRFDALPDYQDFERALEPFIALELARVRFEEARRRSGNDARIRVLADEIKAAEARCGNF